MQSAASPAAETPNRQSHSEYHSARTLLIAFLDAAEVLSTSKDGSGLQRFTNGRCNGSACVEESSFESQTEISERKTIK